MVSLLAFPFLDDPLTRKTPSVNTRCVYHRIAKSRSDPDNMTLCPILDFANHTANPPYTFPQPSPGEIWNSGPSIKKKLGDPFILLSPSTSSISIDQELFLRYGTHSNSTLFAEYGFVNMSPSDGTEGEVEMDALVEALFDQKGATGLWMKEVLVQEGYWGDWTMHSTPAQAFPSYRLITALRIFHLVANTDTVPEDSESLLEIWRDTTLGKRGIISEENERLWRATSMRLCGSLIEEAEKGITTIRDNDIYIGLEDTNAWLGSVRLFIEILHREGIEVAKAVEGSLREGLDF
ncbi:hypothetical protein B0H34DRAFT_694841 [Crassisporium funariophilum]|nr:hypothetical protein B0H34DRAFT_694841 [Crassisporium funariophilum]